MTRHEWNQILNWMTDRWEQVARWSLDKQQAYFEDLEQYPHEAVSAVIHRKYEAGSRYAPNGGEVLAALRESGATTEHRLPHSHTWAILEYEDQRDDGLRFAVCAVTECDESRLASPETLRTAGGA